MSKKKAPAAALPAPVTLNAPFAGLAALRDSLPGHEPRAPAAVKAPRAPARAVVRYERKGRGGKEATVIEQLMLSPGERAEWLLGLKKALGCVGTLEGEALVLQGDQRVRVRAWLEARGVARISVG